MKIRKEPFHLIGLRMHKKTTNEGGQSGVDCGNLWQRFEQQNIAGKIPGKLGNEVYAVYFDYDGDHTQPFSYFVGCRVGAVTAVPHGMDSLYIPAQDYKLVTAGGTIPDCIAAAWRKIWDSETGRAFQYDFEVYDQRSKDWKNAEIDIFISTL
jgi:predicted transcriptional regulator YdeE